MTQQINITKTNVYSDVNISFLANPVTGDIGRISASNSIKTAVYNCILTKRGERPFNPYFGADIYTLLFDQYVPETKLFIYDQIVAAVENYDSRVKITNVVIDPISHGFTISVGFTILNTEIVDEISATITRLR